MTAAAATASLMFSVLRVHVLPPLLLPVCSQKDNTKDNTKRKQHMLYIVM
jgi:hypothetical protein